MMLFYLKRYTINFYHGLKDMLTMVSTLKMRWYVLIVAVLIIINEGFSLQLRVNTSVTNVPTAPHGSEVRRM